MKTKMLFLLLLVGLGSIQCKQKTELKPLWKLEGLDMVESVLYDAKRERLYVTCVEGKPMEKDGKGSVVTVSLDGKLLEDKWVQGLNAPTGMAMVGDELFVADVDRLIKVDLKQDKPTWSEITVPGSKFLNDLVATADGTIYISDMLGDAIYKYKEGAVNLWIQTPDLENPNGLLLEGDKLVVASFGAIAKADSGKKGGHLKTVSLVDGKVMSLGNKKPVGSLDGIIANGPGSYLVTDWTDGNLLEINAKGNFKLIQHFNPYGTADLAVIPEKKMLLLPQMMANALIAYSYPL